MNTVLRLEIAGFYVQEKPDPQIVTRDAHVLDANLAAQALGVRNQMTVRNATNLAPQAKFVAWKEEDFHERQQAWLDLCVQFSDVIEPDDQHTAYLDLSAHPNPTDIADRVVTTIGHTVGLKIRSGLGTSKWIALLSARHQDFGIAQRAPREFLYRLPVTELIPVEAAHQMRLRFLGYHTIGQVAALDLQTLRGQFGEVAHTIRRAAMGTLNDPVRGCYPLGSFADRIVFAAPVECNETLTKNLGMLAQRIGGRLTAKGLEGSHLELSIETESQGWHTVSREFAKPIRCPRTTFIAMQTLWDLNIPQEPVHALGVRISELHPVKGFQPTLIGCPSENSRAIQLQRTMSQLQTTFGEGVVQRASQVQIPRRVRVLKEWQIVLGWR